MAKQPNVGGRPKGVPVSPIRSIITRLRELLPESYEIVRAATSFERKKKDLKKRLRKNQFSTIHIEEELQYKLDTQAITQEQYDKAIHPKELQKEAYKEELADITVDPVSLQTAKWNIEKNLDAVIKAGTDEKNRQALKNQVKEALDGDVELSEDDYEDEGGNTSSGVVGRLQLVQRKE